MERPEGSCRTGSEDYNLQPSQDLHNETLEKSKDCRKRVEKRDGRENDGAKFYI